jgi:RNA polymerase sigma factor (sigma-70 family)
VNETIDFIYKIIFMGNELFKVLLTLIGERGEGMDVARWVKKAKKGNKEALLHLIMSEKDVYYRLAFSYMRNTHDAMDAMEEMIVTIYEKIGQLKKEEAFYSWSKTILVNVCKQLVHKRGKLVLLEDWSNVDDSELDQAVSSDPYRRSEQQMDIEALLLQVNEHQREAIQLKYFHDLDYQTIADITKVSIGTVKSRIYHGLQTLKNHYRGDVDEQ